MQIPCKEIGAAIEETLRYEVEQLANQGRKPKLTTILLGESSEQISFVTIKERVAKNLGIGFEFIHLLKIPAMEEFTKILDDRSADPEVTGIIVQHPFPDGFKIAELYSHITAVKEIEGHTPASQFIFPLSLSVLTGLKYIFNGNKIDSSSVVDFEKDTNFFQKNLLNKKIVIAGRGPTGGKPIGEALSKLGVSFETVHSQTAQPEKLFQQADIIITATGRKIITSDLLKKGVILLNVGLRKENGNLKGDYEEAEIAEIASYYTPTPGGLGPIDVLYLYKNLIDAAKLQV